VTIDDFRADGFKKAGGVGSTPTLDRLAKSGVWFPTAFVPTPLPRAAAATLLTGLPPWIHGAFGPGHPLDAESPTLASLLEQAGWRTAAIVSSKRVGLETGLARGFTRFEEPTEIPPAFRSANEAAALARKEIETPTGRPLFLWVQLSVRWSGPNLSDLRRSRLAYASAMNEADEALDEILNSLAARSGGPKLLLVTGLFGAELGEHADLPPEGESLRDPLVTVPIVASLPGIGAVEGSSAASHLDIAPTILAFAGIEKPASMPGRRLDTLALEPAPVVRDFLFESRLPELLGSGSPLHAWRRDGWKLIERGDLVWLHAVDGDPGEQVNLAKSRLAELERSRRDRLAAWTAQGKRATPPLPVSPLGEAEARALGYLR
jgi:arylsulfatase A-like enzyme